MELVFRISSLLVMPMWLGMILAPRWTWTRRIMSSPTVVVIPAALYVALVLPGIANILPVVMQPELATIAKLLGTPEGATIGWVHFLAFDLFVGRWVYLDAHERGLSPWVVSPVLFLVLMLGPLGFCVYLLLRAVHPRHRG